MKGFCLVILAGLLWGAAGCLRADSPPPPGDPDQPPAFQDTVVVTATGNETPLKTIGGSVTVLSRADLLRGRYRTVEEALAATPGVQVIRSGSTGHAATVMIRGAKSEATLVMMDGIELNDPMSPGRGFDFGNLTLDNVERIEIMRGPQSMLFGSDATGGVINIITRTGEGKPSVTASLEAGAYRTWIVQAGMSGGNKTCQYGFSASRSESDGFSAAAADYGNTEPDGWRNATISGRIHAEVAPGLESDVTVHFLDARLDLDNWGGAYGDDPNYRQFQQQVMGRAELQYRHPGGFWRQMLGFSYADTGRDYRNDEDSSHPGESSRGTYKGILKKLEWQHLLFPWKSHVITAGYEFQQEQGYSDYRSDSFWGPYIANFPNSSSSTHSLYVQDQMEIGQAFFLTGGARLDDHERFGRHASYRIMPVLLQSRTGTRWHAGLGSGFKAPSLYQLYAPATEWGAVGNPDLRPERSLSVDGGVDQFLFRQTVWVSATGFYNRFDDLIDFTDGYRNVGRARTAGAEVVVNWVPSRRFNLSSAYTFTASRNLDTGQELARRASHIWTGGVEFKPSSSLRLFSQLLVKGRRWDMDYSGYPAVRVWMEPYAQLDVLLSYRWRRQVEFYGKFQNLLDPDAEDIFGYALPGRAAYGGVKWNGW